MKKTILILTALALIASSYGKTAKKTEKQRNIYEQIQFVIEKSGFIKLPLVFDASNEEVLTFDYFLTDFKTEDTLLFGRTRLHILGFLPDTTNYYAFLYLSVGDMLYPTIRTMDKNWQKIDEKVICTWGCLTSPLVDVTSCYDSVWIYEDLKIKSISRVVGTIETEENSTSEVLDICNTKILNGFIDKNGKINIKESGLRNCNE